MSPQSLTGIKTDDTISKDLSTVLVLGGDACSVQLVERLCEEGLSIIYLGDMGPNATRVKQMGKIQLIPDGFLKWITGVIGAFNVSIQTRNGVQGLKAGFVVVAQPPTILPKFENYGVKPANNVLSLSPFFDDLQREERHSKRKADWRHIAFFVGLDGAADTGTFSKVFDCIDILIAQGQVQCYVFTRHLKVAENGLEARYRRIREAGTLVFVFEHDCPVVEQTIESVKIVFSDSQLSSEFELTPDVLVIDEKLRPPTNVDAVRALIPSSLSSKPYLTVASPRYPGVSTAKVGVFAVGAARGEFYRPKIADDVNSVVGSIKKIVALQEAKGRGVVAVVEPATCTLCLTCVRVCPHAAIEFGVSARVDSDACLGCGICAAECPMQSIALGQRKTASENSYVIDQHGLQVAAHDDRKIVAFLCEHSAANAFCELSSCLKAMVNPIVVPCAGAVGEVDIIQTLLNGAQGTIVAGCFRGNCASVYGTNRAAHRVSLVQEALVDAGLTADRLVFVPSASNASHSLALAIEQLLEMSGCQHSRETSSTSLS